MDPGRKESERLEEWREFMGDRRVSSLSKGLQVIQKFVFEKDNWGIREIARELGHSKSTAHRLLQSLCEEGFLEIHGNDHKYAIGPELWRLGVALKARDNLHTIAMSIIRKHADTINETMIFFTYGQGGVIFEGVAECDHALHFRLKLGVPYTLHRGPAGKTILAFLPADEAEGIYKRIKKDPSVDLTSLKKVVEKVKVEGYSSARGERAEGVVGFAAPILGPERTLLGGVGLYLPDARYRAKERQKYVDTVKACAWEISSVVNPGQGRS
jgi:DNA-binding IclR family transcriptional regulator